MTISNKLLKNKPKSIKVEYEQNTKSGRMNSDVVKNFSVDNWNTCQKHVIITGT